VQPYTLHSTYLIAGRKLVTIGTIMASAKLSLLLSLPLLSGAAFADSPAAREPFAKAHVTMVARAQSKDSGARLVEIEIWAEGSRLRARLHDDNGVIPGELWIDGPSAEAVQVIAGKVVEPKKRSLEQGLKLSLGRVQQTATSNNDRVAGHSCKLVSERLAGGLALTRCLWRGLPLSIELSGRGYSFNAAATLVEEGAVTVADLQPPPGVPPASASLNAAR